MSAEEKGESASRHEVKTEIKAVLTQIPNPEKNTQEACR